MIIDMGTKTFVDTPEQYELSKAIAACLVVKLKDMEPDNVLIALQAAEMLYSTMLHEAIEEGAFSASK